MGELACRFPDNPILIPAEVPPSDERYQVEALLNPGVFRYQDRIGLLIRVCERPAQQEGVLSFPIRDRDSQGGTGVVRFNYDDPLLVATDPRIVYYDGEAYLTTLSHLRLAWSIDGHRFEVEPQPFLVGEGPLESFGVEDCRVSQMEEEYLLTYSAVSPAGVGVALASTRDWRSIQRYGMILPPTNKDCAIFEQRFGGEYLAIHRPSGVQIGGNYIWLARSLDLKHWGGHQCLARPRPGMWDGRRIGAGAAPILTDHGYLEIYHGADQDLRYCLGALLLDREDPSRVLARSDEPIMEPSADYEKMGFFGNVVFTNGQIVRDDTLTIYYGAADSVICGAEFSISKLIDSLTHIPPGACAEAMA